MPLNEANQKRANLRPQLLSGKSKNHPFKEFSQDWLRQKWPELLDAHFACPTPGESVALQDTLHMINTGEVKIICSGSQKEFEKPRAIAEAERLIIKDWYDKKDRELETTRGDCYVAQRNLSAQAATYHNVLLEAVAQSKGDLQKQISGQRVRLQ